jgi:hypothetical protein
MDNDEAGAASGEWHDAFMELIVEHFDQDKALLLLRLLEKPDDLREALVASFAPEGEEEDAERFEAGPFGAPSRSRRQKDGGNFR